MRVEDPRLLLRDAMERAKRAAEQRGETATDARVARDVFNVSPASLSEWLSGNSRPSDKHRLIAEEWAGVPVDLWATDEEREQDRKARERRALLPVPPAPRSKPSGSSEARADA